MKSVKWIVSYILVASLGLWLAFAMSMKLLTPANSQEAPANGDLPAEFMNEVEATQVAPTAPPPIENVPAQIPAPPEETPVGDAVTAPPQAQEFVGRDGYIYDPTGKRDPFKVFKAARPGLSESATRQEILEPLQRWDIDRLKVVGILWDVRTPRAMISDPDGKVFVVTKNSKVGRNEGFVATIREGEVVVIETKYDEGKAIKEPRVMEFKK